jgi:hypothetical protein
MIREARPFSKEIAMTKNLKPASIYRRIFNGMLEARQREANRHINRALQMMDDDALIERGLKRDRLAGQRFNLY